MKLVSFGPPGRERPGVLVPGGVLDLCAREPLLPGSCRELLARDRLAEVRELAANVRTDDPDLVRSETTRLGPPIPDPTKIVCIGLNYADHAAEQNRPLPETPLLFAKAPTSLCGTGDSIVLPDPESRVDPEAELAFVVGRRAYHVRAEDAYSFVAGYMIFDDVSSRLAQFADKQWFRGKSFDTFAPCGPYLLTGDDVPDPHALAIELRVNGESRQKSNTDQMVFGVPQLVEYISRFMTLVPGDIVATGTPAGVGVFRDPPLFLEPGDRVEVRIDRLGVLENPVCLPE